MTALHNITIRGFKSIKSVESLRINPVNVLVGANGSGKSNLLSALTLVREAGRGQGRLMNYVAKAGGAERILHFGSRTTKRLEICAEFADGHRNCTNLEPAHGDSLQLVYPHGEPGPVNVVDFNRQRYIDSWVLHHFHDAGLASPMKKTVNLNDNRFLRPDGSNLAAFLFLLRLKHPGSYSRITRTIQLAAPFFDDFALKPQALNPETILLEWQHKGSDSYFNADALSDGTLRFIALTTLLLQPDSLRPPVILLDEPELGLHPYAITLLSAMVKKAAVNSRVIIATQSPRLLDHFEPEDVIVANRVNGEARFERLNPEALEERLEDYSLGELWEKNDFTGRPSDPRPPLTQTVAGSKKQRRGAQPHARLSNRIERWRTRHIK